MDTAALESFLDGAEETDTLEFKAAMDWNCASLVKDILAMGNVLDGGHIIIGVEDETFERQGLSNDQLDTYQIEVMRDQVAPFADPEVVFRLHKVSDSNGLDFAVIEVSPFSTTPIVCRRDGADVQAGTVYFRSRSRRPASARVATSADMQSILDVAVGRRMRHLQRIGLQAAPQDGVDYDEELGGL